MSSPRSLFSTENMMAQSRPFTFLILPSLNFPLPRKFSRSSLSSSSSSSSTTVTPTTTTQISSNSSPSPASPATEKQDRQAPTPAPTPTIRRTRPDVLRCKTCSTEFAYASQIISKGFTGRQGRAYLVSPPQQPLPIHASRPRSAKNNLFNVRLGKVESRSLVTGWHDVADISCRSCGETVGWKYVDARESGQKYKIGKFILETMQTVRCASWEDVDVGTTYDGRAPPLLGRGATECVDINWAQHIGDTGTTVSAVEFDSDNEDECDEIFAGTWDPALVAKRRKKMTRFV